MTETATWRQYISIQTDRWAVLLALLFLGVIAGSLSLIPWVESMGTQQAFTGSTTTEQAAAGGGWAIAEAIAAGVLLGIVLLWKMLPEWVTELIKDNVTIALWMMIGGVATVDDVFLVVLGSAVGFLTIAKTAEHFDVYWLLHNVFALGAAIFAGVLLGYVFPLAFLVMGAVGLTIYDHVFANKKQWMFQLGEGMLRAKLPVVVFAFPRLRADWDEICDGMIGDSDKEFFADEQGFGIGTADLFLPAGLAVAVVKAVGTPIGGVVPVVGLTIGVIIAAFRLRWQMVNIGSGAGMPAITSGALGGWAVGVLVVMTI